MPVRPALAILVALTALAPLAFAANPGGKVNNKDPSVEGSSAAGSVPQNPGVGLFTVEVRDQNKEVDMVELKVEVVAGPVALASTHVVTAAERETTSRPSDPDWGWTVWNSGADADGRLSFVYKHAYGVAGTYTWRFSVRDDAAGAAFQWDPELDITQTVGAAITVEPEPVRLDGTLDAGARWGGWAADPGQTLVPAANYAKVTNSGVTPRQTFVVAFSGGSFVGVADPAETIPIAGNVRFLWWEDTTPGTTAPSEAPAGTWDCAPGGASVTGSVAPAFTTLGAVIYVRYCILQVPDPTPDQDYAQRFTVTAV